MKKTEQTEKQQGRKKHIYRWVLLIGVLLVILLNAAAWAAPAVSEKTDGAIGAIGMRPISIRLLSPYLRESAICFRFLSGNGCLLPQLFCCLHFWLSICCICFFERKKGYRRFHGVYNKVIAGIVLAVCLIMTFNCTIYYHCSALTVNEEKEKRQYYISELQALRNYIVEQCNEYSTRMERDENGFILYDGDMQEKAKEALHNIAGQYPRLAGYYPDVKHMMFSNLMSQGYMAGYYFPFSMEANCNGNMYITNYPATYCHELAHLHGYIYEDEANFISYLACIESGDDFMAYAGYLSVLAYVDNAYYEAIGENAQKYLSNVQITEQVVEDDVFLLPETWEK